MMKHERAPLSRQLPIRRIGASTLLLAVLAGCGSGTTEKYIDCLTSPGKSVSADLDINRPGERAVLGDKHQRPPHPEAASYDDTYKIEVFETSEGGDNKFIASSNSGASPVGVGGTLKQLQNEPNNELLLFHSPREPGQSPPYYQLTARLGAMDSTVVNVVFSCDPNQLPA